MNLNVTAAEESRRVGLIARARAILLASEVEWEVIDAERATILGLFVGYACILAAIRPIAEIPQHLLITRWQVATTVEIAALRYGVSLIKVLIVGLIINGLAPIYHGQRNLVQAMKLSIYAQTAGWVVGILYIMPIPGFLAMLAGLYGFYILCLGIPRLMKTPRDDFVGYFVGVGFSVFAVAMITEWLVNLISVSLLAGAPLSAAAAGVVVR